MNGTQTKEFPQTVILAGGMATRLGELSKTTPKALIEVAGEPFIAHQLRLLRREGVSKVVLCVGHFADQIRDFVGNGERFGLHVEYSVDGPTLLGTGGALRRALPLLDDVFAITYGDAYLDIKFAPLLEQFQSSRKLSLMSVLKNENQWDGSNVIFEHGMITSYDKQNRVPEMKFIDYGILILRRSVLETLPEGENIDLSVVFKKLVADKQMAGFEVTQRFYEIGTHAGLVETQNYMTANLV